MAEGLKRLIPLSLISGIWRSSTAGHADEALEYVQENPVDVVISDVNMPDKTGLDMIREMERNLTRCCLYPALRLPGV